MLEKAVNGYTAAQIDRALRGQDLRLTVRIRGELLDLDNVELFDLKGILADGNVSHNCDQPIKRGAQLRSIETLRDSQHSAELAAYSTVITAQGRLFWLRMSQASGNAPDSSGNSRTFTANGGITYGVGSLVMGDQLNNAITLNGTTGYFSIADAAWMDVTNLCLVLAWRGTGVSQTLIDRDDGSSNRFWRFEVDSSGFLSVSINFTTGSPTRKTFASTVKVNDGIAHLLMATYDGAYVTLWVDGKRVLRTAETRTMATGTCAIRVGVTVAGTNFSSGTFDEVGMLGRAPTAREIRDEYQAWSAQTNELLLDRDRGDRVKVWYGIRMLTDGTDGTPWAEWPQGVFVLTTPLREVKTDEGVEASISCQDQTRILSDDKFTVRTTCAAAQNFITGTNGVLQIAQSAGFSTTSWAVTSTSLVVVADIDFEIGSSKLDAINYLLNAINYKPIRFNGDGAAIIEPNKLDVDLPLSDTLATDTTSVILLEGQSEQIEARKVINQVIVATANPDTSNVQGNAVNDNSGSPTSQVFNAPNILTIQVDVPDQTTADALAQQKLSDATARYARRVKLQTYPRPIHEDRDRLHLTLTDLDKNEDFVEEEWTLSLNPTGMMEHSFLTVVDVR